MDRGEKLSPRASEKAQWMDLNKLLWLRSATEVSTSRGELACRSGLAFPRLVTLLDVGRVPRRPLGTVADYYAAADAAACKWLNHGLV